MFCSSLFDVWSHSQNKTSPKQNFANGIPKREELLRGEEKGLKWVKSSPLFPAVPPFNGGDKIGEEKKGQ